MTNNNNVTLDRIKNRIIQNRWFYLALCYSILYAFIVFQSQSEFLRANQNLWTQQAAAQLNRYTLHFYVFLLMMIIAGSSWTLRKRSGFVVALVMIIGLFYNLPQLWIYQVVYAILVVIMMINMSRKERLQAKPSTESVSIQ